MSKMIPMTRPRMSQEEVREYARKAGLDLDKYPFFLIGFRGYYKTSMGHPGRNDRGIYDDAIFVVSPAHFSSYNANTDPSKRRNGSGFGRKKGMAVLKPGVWMSYCYSLHNWVYPAICQRKGPVTVMRDKVGGSYEHTGMFGINIHKGGMWATWSEGCQTIPKSQWKAFINAAVDQAKRYYSPDWKNAIIPYVLIDLDAENPPASDPEGTMRTTANLRLRMGPSTDHPIILTIPQGSLVEEVKKSNNGWTCLTYKGQTGYAASQYLT